MVYSVHKSEKSVALLFNLFPSFTVQISLSNLMLSLGVPKPSIGVSHMEVEMVKVIVGIERKTQGRYDHECLAMGKPKRINNEI